MRIGMVTPAPPRSRYGNRITALRWASILRKLGHRVTVAQDYAGEPYDTLIALHARRSHQALRRFEEDHPTRPLMLALTGTDLYQDLETSAEARQSLELADRLIVLQGKASEELDPHLHGKVRVIYQSIAMPWRRADGTGGGAADPANGLMVSLKRAPFEVCVIGHLREVKDPFRAAKAARLLPPTSRVRVTQIGGELEDGYAAQALAEMDANPRYRWVGEKPRWRVLRILARSRLLVLSSRLEGGANVLSEAIVAAVPVLSSRIAGSIGILGEDYPGYFDVGDTEALARLMTRAETDAAFLADLQVRCSRLAPRFDPSQEAGAWADLLAEFF